MVTPFEYDEFSMPTAQKIHNPLKMQSIVDADATVENCDGNAERDGDFCTGGR
jgi:hypothetical protein